MQTISKFLALGSILALAACNSSSVTTPGGSQCPLGYNPTPVVISGTQKAVPKDPAQNKSAPADSQMPQGRYIYTMADIVYSQTQKAGADPVQIQYHDLAGAGVSAAQNIICMNNAKPHMTIADQQTDAVTDVVVCPDFSQVVKTRHFVFGYNNGSIFIKVPEIKDLCLTTTDGVGPKTTVDPLLIKDDALNYEFRTQTDATDGTSTFTTSIRLTYSPFLPGETPVECVNKCFPAPAPGTPGGPPAVPAAKTPAAK
jgi:hypothetical protein